MDQRQTSEFFFKIAAIVSPFLAAALSVILTYYFTFRAKKWDILYASKIPAIKEIAQKLVELKKYCSGVLAYLHAIENAPYYHPPGGALDLWKEIADNSVMNSLFVSAKSRKMIDDILQNLGIICNIEMRLVLDPTLSGIESPYETMHTMVEECLQSLYADLKA
jgi:hypothetical protein